MAKKSIVVTTREDSITLKDEVVLDSIIAIHDTHASPWRTLLILKGGRELHCMEDPNDIRKTLHEERVWDEVQVRTSQPV